LKWMRKVSWKGQVPRDSLKTATRNSLGAISALFLIRDEAASDVMAHMVPIGSEAITNVTANPTEDRELLQEAIARSAEFTEDRIAALNWEQMQELVSEILKAMGYRTRIAAKGSDRGVDVFASPDGLGLQEPRIFVEVKHRPGTQISADMIRSFIGGRQQGDRCLYVSTGGFSREARYEAERSSIPLTLITLPQLRELLVEHYEALSPIGTALVPLERIYWPT
jgi:restriction system protein